ncbi:MAG: OmpH family outer membrane protein [Desulfobacterales bacterium]|nr:OmpH family outer membrane protein [Desulfobacterales bacterium]
MYRVVIGVIVCIGLMGMGSIGYSADVAKIGLVDFQKILENSEAGKKAQSEINSKGKELEEDLKKRSIEIEEIKKKFERDAMVISREERDERERDYRIKVGDFKSLQTKYTNNLKELEVKLIDVIKEDVMKIIEAVGKNEGYLLIMEKREAGVLYSPTTIDISDQVIREYNKKKQS